jgi:glycosyltransferase involved in cell wall biosynthesis
MRIAILTDAWLPQVNGVVRTLGQTIHWLESWGNEVTVIHPGMFVNVPMPTYPDIRLAWRPGATVRRVLDEFQPEAIHIATEGPIGWSGRRYCRRRRLPFTTAYHTRFPEYVRLRVPVPLSWSYVVVRRFHGAAVRTLVTTDSMRRELQAHGFDNLVSWSRGVDVEQFRPREKRLMRGLPQPIFLHLGRVAVEKNIKDFLDLDLPGSKVVIGDGPARPELQRDYPQAQFLGYRENGDLAAHLASADVLVFPSRTDTFGLVMLEAMASGVPVAAYPVPGPGDVIENGVNGWLDEDLRAAALSALQVDRASCRRFAEGYSWENCSRQFLSHVQPLGQAARAMAEVTESS